MDKKYNPETIKLFADLFEAIGDEIDARKEKKQKVTAVSEAPNRNKTQCNQNGLAEVRRETPRVKKINFADLYCTNSDSNYDAAKDAMDFVCKQFDVSIRLATKTVHHGYNIARDTIPHGAELMYGMLSLKAEEFCRRKDCNIKFDFKKCEVTITY